MNLPADFISKLHFSGVAIADLLFSLLALFTAIISLVLFFHWRRFAVGGVWLTFMEVIYLAGAALLLLMVFLK
jgi:hypothetical protein